MPTKSCANSSNYCRALFLFLQAKHSKQAQTDLLSTRRSKFCKLRGSALRHRNLRTPRSILGIPAQVHQGDAIPAMHFLRSDRFQKFRRGPARPSSSIRRRATRTSSCAFTSSRLEVDKSTRPFSYPQADSRRLVESASSVCYFLMARGVAQLGSAPALGAGGRPFKSARPDRASSSGG